MIYFKDIEENIYDSDFRKLEVKAEDLNTNFVELKSYEKECLTRDLNKKYLETQNINIVGDVNLNIPLSGDKFIIFQKIIDRAKSDSQEDTQEYQFETDSGELYYVKLSNFFWVKIFGDLSKYSSANRRLKKSIEKMIDDSSTLEDFNNVTKSINLFPSAIVLDVSKLIQVLSKDSTIPSQFMKSLVESSGSRFNKISLEDSLEDINDLRKKYGV